ncbi:chromate efflux transporter [Pedobacter gandavensis]|uniref:Chromate efflux transporter n=1 Tax=Pedobacter gandavensis TaxID=2679963 RepID=A0ABR6ESJ6_9SPHI|nr:chromate efflux transporter [Pedobacter gandavensis]MBB2148232.1 chromate efflux transporter [Pedobacter gandavensis]
MTEKPLFKDALRFWFKLGWISFGGTVGHINIMHDYLVDKKKWISSSRFFHALNLCMLLPGPEAQQLAIYMGWQLHGKKGGLIAGILFVLPSMFILLLLSVCYVYFGNQPWMFAMFNGFKPAVISIIIVALLGIGKKALHTPYHVVLALLAFSCIFFFNISMVFIILGTIGMAIIFNYLWPSLIHQEKQVKQHTPVSEKEYYFNKNSVAAGTGTNWRSFGLQIFVFVLLWLIPIVALYYFSNDFSFWRELTFFFSKTAFLTIGGSYTVLPYVAQFTVTKLNWLSKMQMIDGFALAETTPGPLIIVVAFVGFMAAYNHFDASIPMGVLGLLLTSFYTFLPSFLFIFVGGPIIEKAHGNTAITNVLGFVTAAVVGVILNLTLFLGKDVLFPGGIGFHNLDFAALIWILITLVFMKRFRVNVLYIIGISLIFGLLHYGRVF